VNTLEKEKQERDAKRKKLNADYDNDTELSDTRASDLPSDSLLSEYRINVEEVA